MAKTVFVGMSGGVDSSVSALLLKEQGYKVTGIYMKNWSKDLPGMKCPWAEDLADAKRVAVKLGIDFEVWDFEDAYREKVVEYMLEEFRKGNTPNPDVMCNQEIKFKLFYEKAIERGADFIATGHYARIIDGKLARAVDENKDQTYFLYRISEEALAHTIFPIGDMLKPDVKKLAKENNLHNAYKKESMGVCFVGEVGMKDFLKEYIDIKPGEIREIESEKVLGYHEGAVFYTIGQRHGLYLNGVAGEINDGLPYYVVAKDLDKNIVYVSKNLNDEHIWTDELELKNVVLRAQPMASLSRSGARPAGLSTEVVRQSSPRENEQAHSPLGFSDGLPQAAGATARFAKLRTPLRQDSDVAHKDILVRLRHRAPLVPAKIVFTGNGVATLEFENKIKRPASGQSAVIYDGEICLGGGIIS